MIPSANTVKRLRLPPEKMDSSPKNPAPYWLKNCSKTVVLMPGVGMKDPRRYTASSKAVKMIRFRRSGISVMLLKELIMPDDLCLATSLLDLL